MNCINCLLVCRIIFSSEFRNTPKGCKEEQEQREQSVGDDLGLCILNLQIV